MDRHRLADGEVLEIKVAHSTPAGGNVGQDSFLNEGKAVRREEAAELNGAEVDLVRKPDLAPARCVPFMFPRRSPSSGKRGAAAWSRSGSRAG